MGKATDLKNETQSPMSIYRTIRLSFGAVTLAMFSLFWIVIYVAEYQLERISLHHWLDTEASAYTRFYSDFGENSPLPNENEFKTFWSEEESMPDWLIQYDEQGFYEHLLGEEDKHFIVFSHPSEKGLMYILFQDDADDYLDSYEDNLHYYTFVLGVVLSLLILGYGSYMVRAISKPLWQVEAKIAQMSPEHDDFSIETHFAETRKIEQALLNSKQNIAGYFQRETEFSRFASHELRTPIMIIQGSAELLSKIPDTPPVAHKAIKRIENASDDMKVLTEAFLLLGKENIDASYYEKHDLNNLLEKQLAQLEPLFLRQNASYWLEIEPKQPCYIFAPLTFMVIVINNLVKNAYSYSFGDVDIQLNRTQLQISNHHDGNQTDNSGYGCGLAIVERICERMGWDFNTLDEEQYFISTVNFKKT
ncbi:histidine kinase dimerization/phospho-acceptor domain-containing protein [Vibrio sp. R78045]|uniref:sensor histidine kinase n=1 Tax=Vibrio sp. R78045 TaxID=3093868 RepID=UPI0036F1B623